ncbi:MAG: PspC domain-containing protein [Prevotella sp.]|jgi:phage shock protein PspC (stress-responsive transcriptional regulator)|nr:PspC domain-containing protein [Bacteroidales bacterium]MBR4240150.1 PspC domain-containing protein [Prevotella sp.]MBR4698930.1 PspC domain-containing protein [Prevotella sp.]
MATGKKIYRSNDRIIGGVCAGIAEYFDVDPTILRIGYVVLTIFTAFSGIILYPFLWIIIPSQR